MPPSRPTPLRAVAAEPVLGAEAWRADTPAVPWVAVASVAAWAAGTSAAGVLPVDSTTATTGVPAAWPYPSGTMTIFTAAGHARRAAHLSRHGIPLREAAAFELQHPDLQGSVG